MAEEVKLLGMWASPFTRRIELALRLKGVQYEYIEEDLHNKSALLLKYNPIHKKIPVLVHNGKPISESLLILEYIDETWQKNPLLPKDPYDRAMARFWARFVDDQEILWIALKGSAAEEEKEQMQAIEEICQRLKWLDNELKGKDFYGGETVGYLDIAVFFIIYWIYMRQDFMIEKFITEEKFPVLYKWFQKLLDMDLVKGCLPPIEKHIPHIREFIQASKASKSASK